MFTAALFTAARTWKQPQCPCTDEWIEEPCYIYATEYYSAMKKNEILTICDNRKDLEAIMLSEVSQIEKSKYHMMELIGGL